MLSNNVNQVRKNSESVSTPEKMLRYTPNSCFLNATYNKNNAYRNLNLKVVIGSLGLNGWFEFGGKDWSINEWKQAKKGKCSWDAHCWLEDDNGNVYDYCFNDYLWVSRIRLWTIGDLTEGVIERVNKEDCLKRGLTYIAAPINIQKAICIDFKLGGINIG